MLCQLERHESIPIENQCVFIRGFRISIREGIFSPAFRGPLEISYVSDSTPDNIFGQSDFYPFSPQTGGTGTWIGGWFGGGDRSQTSPPGSRRQVSASTSAQSGMKQDNVPDAVLDSISTTTEVVLFIWNYHASIDFAFSAISSFQNYPKIFAAERVSPKPYSSLLPLLNALFVLVSRGRSRGNA